MSRATLTAFALPVLSFAIAGCDSRRTYPEPPAGSFSTETVQVYADGTAESVTTARVTRDFFPATGVAPMLGRSLVEADSRDGAVAVVMLHEGFWQRRFNRSPSIIGHTIQINGRDVTVIGVMPRSFVSPAGAELWLPKSGQ